MRVLPPERENKLSCRFGLPGLKIYWRLPIGIETKKQVGRGHGLPATGIVFAT